MDDKEEARFQVADKRFWVQDEELVERAEIPERKYPSYVEELRKRTELAEQKLKEKIKQLEEDNEAFRERLRREMERRLDREKQGMLRGFLEVLDNLERALSAAEDPAGLKAGVKLNLELFLTQLKANGVEAIDPPAPTVQPS